MTRLPARRTLLAGLLFSAGVVNAQPVVVAPAIPYADDAHIQQKILDECVELNTQFAHFIKEYADENGVEVVLGEAGADSGRVLHVAITEAVSQGNAFLGHHKGSAAAGTLVENGREVARFRATRYSMGGAFAGFKGSCSVLGRTVKAMGRDIAEWLKNPVDGAELGDR